MTLTDLKAYFKSFSCKALTNSKKDLSDIQSFVCDIRNNTLADYLHNSALSDTKTGVNCTYLIRDNKGKVAAFFSIRCGITLELNNFDEEYEKLPKDHKLFVKDLYEAYKTKNSSNMYELIEKGKALFPNDIGKLEEIARQNKELESEKINTGNSDGDILYVENTHPAIEITNFCRNTAYTSEIIKDGKIGFGLFWEVIVPKILEINEKIGAEHLYLFAADKSDNEDEKKISIVLSKFTTFLFVRRFISHTA